ncbi:MULTISPECIES: hypothetical protein [unclassified Methylobacterium]|uniref:hypothetical protein n=1 Tax=unclassified Methylobacterium TaxID=2615210 RepID=UPI000AD0BBF4|nr:MULTISPECIES: hypothetical protein [unclassified Methylobacterium]USU30441.1 hypothetical protein NG677_13715 [Methylobacterium sp. OTU13CASTA1]
MRDAGRGADPGGSGSEGNESSGASGRNRRMLWFVVFYAVSLISFTALVYALRFIVRG